MNQATKGRGDLKVGRMRHGKHLTAGGDGSDHLSELICPDQELDQSRRVQDDHAGRSRISAITATTSSAVTDERAAMARAW